MQFSLQKADSQDPDGLLYRSLAPVIQGMGMSLIELDVFRQKKSGEKSGELHRPNRSPAKKQSGETRPGGNSPRVSIRAVVYREGVIGVEDCTKAHRAILPRLELAFPDGDIYLEVSSPGIDRLIKDGAEFAHYTGCGVRCYRTDISAWTAGILVLADNEKIVLRGKDGEITLPYEIIAKARLDSSTASPDDLPDKGSLTKKTKGEG